MQLTILSDRDESHSSSLYHEISVSSMCISTTYNRFHTALEDKHFSNLAPASHLALQGSLETLVDCQDVGGKKR